MCNHMKAARPIPYLEEVRHTPHICLAEGIRSANRAINKVYADHIAGSDVGVAQISLLMRLYYLGEVPMVQLAKHMETDRTTMARNIDILERDGFVEVVEGKDRRSRLVRMTEKGHHGLEDVLPKWRRAQDELRGVLGDELWDSLLKQTRILAELGNSESSHARG